MSQFEFFMTFYGLLLGLAVADLLAGFAGLIGRADRPVLGLLTPLFGGTLFLELMATFLDAWNKLQNVTMNLVGLAIPTAIGVLFFVAARIAVPRDFGSWRALDEYFYANRRWTMGTLIAINILIWCYEFPLVREMVAAERWPNLSNYLFANTLLLALHLVALLARPRWAVAAALGGLIAFFIYYYGDFAAPIFK